ncbi:sodium-dependent proline transporter isoform X1 [Bos taurus]|uniref:sodium-dependent proline transporter isoform X1 n=1 Tax=Bos taurus TaxID=9913 RepID=UPI000383B331|nr:sodium-dependent proline transporter isoform X1 [Bos taurus]
MVVGSPVKELAASMRRKGRGMLGTGDHRWQPQASEVALGGGEEQVDRSQILKVIDFCTEEFVLYLAGNALIHYVSDLSLVLAWALGLQKRLPRALLPHAGHLRHPPLLPRALSGPVLQSGTPGRLENQPALQRPPLPHPGAGAAMLLIVGLVAIYYNMIIAYVLFYLFASLTSNLPWEHCGNWWNTDLCLEHRGSKDGNGALPLNLTSTVSPSEEYWSRYVLHIQGSQGIGSPGHIRWNLCLCLLLAWVIVFLCILKGVKSSGKVVYFTATFPYLILLMLLVRGVTLPGAWKGIQFYLTPQFHHLLSSKVWIEAALQIFYSLGVGFGGLLTFASYNTFHQNIYRDTFIVTLGNAITSILAGFAIFSVLGYMSQELGVPVDQVAKAGPGLAFVVYPQAMTMLPLSPFWSFLFFFMLLTLGLDSQFAFLETIVTAVTDEFPYYLRPKKAVFSGLICVAMYLMGLVLTTDGGMYWLVLLDDYSASFGLMVVVITTCLAVTRVYGIQRFCRDIHMMLGFKPGFYFRACWLFLSPATLLALLVYSIVKYQPSEYGSYRFPAWAELLGILMGLLSCLMIPAGMLVAVLREEGSLWERLQQASRPAMDWGPSLEENRTGMYVATLAGSQSPKPLMVHMRKYGGITSFENTAIEVDREIAEEEESMM